MVQNGDSSNEIGEIAELKGKGTLPFEDGRLKTIGKCRDPR